MPFEVYLTLENIVSSFIKFGTNTALVVAKIGDCFLQVRDLNYGMRMRLCDWDLNPIPLPTKKVAPLLGRSNSQRKIVVVYKQFTYCNES